MDLHPEVVERHDEVALPHELRDLRRRERAAAGPRGHLLQPETVFWLLSALRAHTKTP